MTVIAGDSQVQQEPLIKIQYMKYTCLPFALCMVRDRRLVVANLKDYEPSLHMQAHGTRKNLSIYNA
jgi:hypothetical protein